MTLPLFDRAPGDLLTRLLSALEAGGWRHREDLATQLRVSVRQIRDAAASANGRILSGQNGLILTVYASEPELCDAEARCASQIHEMTRRLAATRHVWETRAQKQSA